MTSAREQQSWRRGRKNSTAQRAVEFLGGGTPAGVPPRHKPHGQTDGANGRSERNERNERNERTKGNQRRRRRPGPPRGERERERPSQLGNPESTSFPTPTTPAPPHIDRDNHRPPNHAPGTPHHRPFPTNESVAVECSPAEFPPFFSVSARATALTHQTTYPSIEKECIPGQKLRETKLLWWPRFNLSHFNLSQVIASQTDDRFFDDHDRTLHLRSILLMILPCD